MPTISATTAQSETAEGALISGTLDADFGADGEGYLVFNGVTMTKDGDTGLWTATTDKGTMSVNVEDKTFTFTPAEGVTGTQQFAFQIFDQDGDSARDAATVSVNIIGKPSVSQEADSLTTHDKEVGESGTSSASGSLAVSMEKEASVTVTLEGVQQEIDLAELTSESGATIHLDEGDLTLHYNAETGDLSYSFEQDTAAVHKEGETLTENKQYDINVTFTDENKQYDINVTFTDSVNQTASVDLTLTITDDVPTFTNYTSHFTSHGDYGHNEIKLDFNNYNYKNDTSWEPESFRSNYLFNRGHFISDHNHKEYSYKDITHIGSGINISAAIVEYNDKNDSLTILYDNNTNYDINNYKPVLAFISTTSESGNGSGNESGLAIYSGTQAGDDSDGEIGGIDGAMDKNAINREAIKIETGDKEAHFITITLNSFYNNGAETERAAVFFYNADGDCVGIHFWDAEKDNAGVSVSNTFYVKDGFTSAYIVPIGHESDFLLNGVSIDYEDKPFWTLNGTISAVSADNVNSYTFETLSECKLTTGKNLILQYSPDGRSIEFYIFQEHGFNEQNIFLGQATIDEHGTWNLNWYNDQYSPEGIAIPVTATDGDGDTVTMNIIVAGTTGEAANVTGTAEADAMAGTEHADSLVGEGGDDLLYGEGGDDILIGDDFTVQDIAASLNINDTPTAENMHQAIEKLGPNTQSETFTNFLERVKGSQDNGDDQLFGGSGDDVLFGMGGDDYLVGDKGSDILFGGAGNDIVVYDKDDFMVSGGTGIDFMVSADANLTMGDLEKGDGTPEYGPIVEGIDVLLKGEDALSLTSMDQLASEYGITVEGNEIHLGAGWTKDEESDNTYTFSGNEGQTLTMEVASDIQVSHSEDMNVTIAQQQITNG